MTAQNENLKNEDIENNGNKNENSIKPMLDIEKPHVEPTEILTYVNIDELEAKIP